MILFGQVIFFSFPFLFLDYSFFLLLPFPISSRGHTLPCRSVGRSVRPSVRDISQFRAVIALLLLPSRLRLDCRVFGLFFVILNLKYREYPAKRYKRKRHNSALEKDISNLKKGLESPVKTILSCFDTF